MSSRRLRVRGGGILRFGGIIVVVTAVFWITGCMERLFYYPTREATPAPTEFPGAEVVRFTSVDGTKLCGWFLPSARGAAISPTIVHFHGNAGSMNSHLWFTEYLPAAGFNVFLFDYRGYGESEGRARKRADLIADGAAAMRTVMARPEVDQHRLGVYGQSLGGSIALNVLASDEFKGAVGAIVLESPFSSWRDIAAEATGGGQPGIISRFLAAVLIKDDSRPLDAIPLIDSPILLLHGDADSIIPTRHSRVLRDAARDAELHELPGGEHNSLRATHPEIAEWVIEFLDRHLSERTSDS